MRRFFWLSFDEKSARRKPSFSSFSRIFKLFVFALLGERKNERKFSSYMITNTLTAIIIFTRTPTQASALHFLFQPKGDKRFFFSLFMNTKSIFFHPSPILSCKSHVSFLQWNEANHLSHLQPSPLTEPASQRQRRSQIRNLIPLANVTIKNWNGSVYSL